MNNEEPDMLQVIPLISQQDTSRDVVLRLGMRPFRGRIISIALCSLSMWFVWCALKVNRANSKGETALMHGAASGSVKIVRMLMKVRLRIRLIFHSS